jgi:hypothetical protein
MKRVWLQRRRSFKKVHALSHAQLTPVRNNNFLFLKETVTYSTSTYALGAPKSSTIGIKSYKIKSKIHWHVQKIFFSLFEQPNQIWLRVFKKVHKSSFILYDVISNFHA